MTKVLVDSNIILDLFLDDPKWAKWSETTLENQARHSTLCINPIIYTEISIGFNKVEEIEEQFSDRCFKNCGDIEFTALITEDIDRIFTPCRYAIQDVVPISTPVQPVIIKEIVSFRGRFCELVHVGDFVRVRGKLEQVSDNKTGKIWYRVLLGRDHTDFMVIEQ